MYFFGRTLSVAMWWPQSNKLRQVLTQRSKASVDFLLLLLGCVLYGQQLWCRQSWELAFPAGSQANSCELLYTLGAVAHLSPADCLPPVQTPSLWSHNLFTMPSSLQSVTASCHLFFQESCNGQYKIFCKQNMLLVMIEAINNEAAKQAGRVWSWVCVRGRSVTCSIGSICCTALTSPRCSAEPSLDAAMCLHGLGSKCRRKCCLQLFLAQPQQPLMKC